MAIRNERPTVRRMGVRVHERWRHVKIENQEVRLTHENRTR